ncbi:MAG: methyltransferase domain-containing protein [Nanoarchaeota archaeon]|nr:methyltransferase domain-containing protein [Nanoarchaeota archaeon]
MKCLFLLSGENIRLAKEEVLSLLVPKKHKVVNNLLILETEDINLADRLAYTKKTFQLLFETNKEKIIEDIKRFEWQSIYKENFCVRIHKLCDAQKGGGGGREGGKNRLNTNLATGWDRGVGTSEKQLADHIWDKLKSPKVNLTNPKTSIEFFITKDKIYAAKLIKELKHSFESRKAHKRPELHPTALNPKLARALINLAGAQKEVMDPFCGAGGILIEAGLMKLKPIGYDLYKEMVKKSKRNMGHYKIKGYKLINQDALKIKTRYDYIVSDLPYGLNTSIWVKKGKENKKISLKQKDKKQRIKNIEEFYLKFLKILKKILKKKAVIIFPHYVNYKSLIKKANLKIEKEFSQFIHGSLTRKIVVLK